jgi:hypothetical protein
MSYQYKDINAKGSSSTFRKGRNAIALLLQGTNVDKSDYSNYAGTKIMFNYFLDNYKVIL